MKPNALMKNALIFCASAMILSGCTAVSQESACTPRLDPAYSIDAEMDYADGEHAAVTLTRYAAGTWDAAFSEPPTLAGVVLSFDGNAVSASYKGLAFTVPKSAMPAKSVLTAATDVLDSLDGLSQIPCTQAEDGTWSSTGESEAGSYTITFGADGTLTGFAVPSQPLTMTFSGYRCNDPSAAVQTETTAPAETTLPPETGLTAASVSCTETTAAQ